jgi:hypothetical protein
MVLTIRPTKAAGFGVVGNTFCGGIGHSTKSGRIRAVEPAWLKRYGACRRRGAAALRPVPTF